MILLIIAAVVIGLLLLSGLFALVLMMPPSKGRPRTGPDPADWSRYGGPGDSLGGGHHH